MVIILRGPAGVGKSTIATLLQSQLGERWVIIDVDSFKHLVPLQAEQANRAERSAMAHSVSYYFMQELCAHGYDVIIEEMFKKPYNDKLVALLKKDGIDYLKVFLSAPADVAVQRSKLRPKDPPEAEIRRHHAETQPLDDDLLIDTITHSPEQIAEQIINTLA